MKKLNTFLLLTLLMNAASGQADTVHVNGDKVVASVTSAVKRDKIYKINPWWELPSAGAAVLLSNKGFRKLEKVSSMTEADILKLNPNDVNSFDRPVIFHNPAKYASAQSKSDLFLNISIFTPAVLALDKTVRKDWIDLLSLYLASHAVDNALYFAAAFPVRRPRPFLYNKDVPMSEKVGDNIIYRYFKIFQNCKTYTVNNFHKIVESIS